jgi:hypothetical protein
LLIVIVAFIVLKVTLTNLFKTTLFSLFAGSVDATIGVTVKPVLIQIFLLVTLPVRSFTVLFIVAVYVVLGESKADGLKVAVYLSM